MKSSYSHLDSLEDHSIYILREAYRKFKRLAVLWSIGKDSSVAAVVITQSIFRPHSNSVRTHRHELQDSGDD